MSDTGRHTLIADEAPAAAMDNGDGPRARWPEPATRWGWWLVATGVVLRLIRYGANRSLWLDEAYLTESLLTYTFRQLATEELMHWQAAPTGFLLLVKTAVTAFGTSEYALRLVPLVAGLASVPLCYAVARRAFPPAGGLVALTLFALLEPLVYYSAEVKQYGTDVAVCLLLLWLAQRVLDRPRHLSQLAALALAGSAALFLSHPAVFVLGGAGLTLFGWFIRRGLWRPAVQLAGVGTAWLALIAFNYVVFLGPLTRHKNLVSYWSDAYMPWDAGAVPWLARSLWGVFTDYGTMWLPIPYVPIATALVGIAWLWRRDRAALAMFVLPILLALVGAAAHRFPFHGRLILFVVPLAILLIGAGAQAVLNVLPVRWRVGRGLFLLFLAGATVGRAAYFAVLPRGAEEMKAVLAHVRDHKRPGDVIYVFNISGAPYRYYRDRYGLGPDRFGLADTEWILGNQVAPTEAALATDLARLRGRPRVWVLLTHMKALDGPDEAPIVQGILNGWGTRLSDSAAKGARVMLYDLRRAGPSDTTAREEGH